MSLLGTHLTLLIGGRLARPAPPLLMQSLESVEVTHSDEGRSGFQITFQSGRTGLAGALEDPLLRSPLLRPFNRVIVIVTFNVRPRVLMDGIITQQESSPGSEPGTSTITVTGEDVSVVMDREDRIAEHPAQPDVAIVAKLIAKYSRYGLVPVPVPPKVFDPPLPIERVPVQQGTDLAFIEELGKRHGYVFYVTPGPLPFSNRAYWGPPRRIGAPQKALSVNFGTQTNVRSISFSHDALSPTLVDGDIQDPRTNRKLPVRTVTSLRPPLSIRPTALFNRGDIRKEVFRASCTSTPSAFGQAQAMTDRSTDQVATATGELDAMRYGNVLTARGLVGMRGAGYSYDGFWYVKKVSHKIRRGEYTQGFTLTRDGVGSTTPVVRP